MLVLNPVYFVGSWVRQFEVEDTKLRPFYVSSTEKKDVPTMYRMGLYLMGDLPKLGAKFITLPYESSDEVTFMITIEIPVPEVLPSSPF